MPFVNIRLYEGHGKERKDELAKRVTEAVHEVCKVPREAVWVVFEDVPPADEPEREAGTYNRLIVPTSRRSPSVRRNCTS